MRVSKLTDYGIGIISHMASIPEGLWTANQLAAKTHIARPTVAKLLKRLAQAGLLSSKRGALGGYTLAQAPEVISLMSIIQALEGPIVLTPCLDNAQHCKHVQRCTMQKPWERLNLLLKQFLSQFYISDFIKEKHG